MGFITNLIDEAGGEDAVLKLNTPAAPSATADASVERDSGDPLGQFIDTYMPAAQRKAKELGVSPISILAQAALETGNGKSIIPGTHNLFNIKDFSGSGVEATDNMTGSRDKYRAYETPDAAFDDHAGLLSRRYKGALNTGDDVSAYFGALKAGGYAEDPDYVRKGVKMADAIRARVGDLSTPEQRIDPERLITSDYEAPVKAENNFVRGAKTALGQTPALLKGLIALGGEVGEQTFGEDGMSSALKKWGLEGYKSDMAALEPLQRKTDSATDAWKMATEEGNFGALLDWAEYGLGYGVAQMGETALTAIGGALIGGASTGGAGAVPGAAAGVVGKQSVKGFVANLIEKSVAKQAAEIMASAEVKSAIAKGTLTEAAALATARQQATKAVAKTIGSTAALSGYNVMMEGGSIYPDAIEQAKAEGREFDGGDLARVAGATLAAAATETITDKLGIDAALGKVRIPGTGRAGRGAVGVVGGGGVESFQEGVQTGIERAGAGKEVFSEEGRKEIIDSAAMGGLPGGVVGGVSGTFRDAPAPAPKPERKPDSPLTNAANAGRVAVQAEPAVPVIPAPDAFAEKSANPTQDKAAAIAARDEINQKIAGVQSLLERTAPGSDEETNLRNVLQSHIAARDEAERRLEILNTFDAPADKRADGIAESDPVFARILSAADRFAQDRNSLSSLDPQERETALRAYSVLRNPTLGESMRRDAAIALLNVFDAIAERRADAAELRQFVNAERAELDQMRKAPPAGDGNPPNVPPTSPPGGGGGGGVSPTQGPTPGFGNMTEFERFLAEERGDLDALRQASAANQRAQKEGQLQDIGAAIDGNRAKQTAENRGKILDAVLSDPSIKDHAKAFRAALIRAGRNDYETITPEEKARIDRFLEVNDTFPQDAAPDVVPSAPNEMPDGLVREKGSRAGDRQKPNAAYAKKAAEMRAKDRLLSAPKPTQTNGEPNWQQPLSLPNQAATAEGAAAKPAAEQPARRAGRKVDTKIDPETDSLFTAIAKLGGISADDVFKGWGHDPVDFKNGRMVGFGLRVVKKNGALSADGVLESLKQYGYFGEDATLSDLEQAFADETSGNLYLTPAGRMRGAERAAEAQHAAMAEAEAVTQGTDIDSRPEALQEEAEAVAEDIAEEIAGEGFFLPDELEFERNDDAEADGMRALGFTEEEIRDALNPTNQGAVSSAAEEGAAGRAEEDGARRADDGFALEQAQNGREEVIPDGDGITKEQVDKERDAVPFSLSQQSQPKPVGVQSGLFTADGRVAKDATAAPAVSEMDALKAEMGQAIGELASILGVKTNMTPEEEVRILPVMSKIFRIAAKMGYITFKDAAVHVVKQLRELGGKELADKISIDNLQSGYINIAKEIGGSKKEALEYESLDELMAGHDALVESIAAAEKKTDANPSDAQKEADNYRKGKFQWNGWTIAVETPKGVERSGKGEDGEEWRVKMRTTYGYFLGTKGADKDHVDVFVGDHPESNKVFIIDQNKVDSQAFDEHKVMIGFTSAEDAQVEYLRSFSGAFGGRVFGRISDAITPEQLKEIMPSLEKKKPFTKPAEEFNYVDPAPGNETPARPELKKVVDNTQSTSETARRGEYKLKSGEIARVLENAERGRFTVSVSNKSGDNFESYGVFSMDDAGTVSKVSARANWTMDYVRDAAEQFSAEQRQKRNVEQTPPVAEPKGWHTSWGTASKYAEALGLSTRNAAGKSMKLPELTAAIEAKLSGAQKMGEPQWWIERTPTERYRILSASGIGGTASTKWSSLSAEQQTALNEQLAPRQVPVEGTAQSEQFKNYANWINGGKEITPGLLEQIRADERLNDGEADKLVAMAEEKRPKARRPIPGDADYTLELAREDLDAMHENTGERWFAEDDRLTERIKRQEKLIKEMEAEVAKPASVKDLALAEQRAAGWNPDWPFIPADLGNADFRSLIAADSSLSDEEKAQIFSAGKKLGVIPQEEQISPASKIAQIRAKSGKTEPIKLSNITVQVSAIVEETGESIKVNERADVALSEIDQRIELAKGLLECLVS